MKAYTGAEICDLVMAGTCPWEYRNTIEKGRYKGFVEITVSDIPTCPSRHKATIAIPPHKYEVLKKGK